MIEERAGKDIWKGLFQFPKLESNEQLMDDTVFFQNAVTRLSIDPSSVEAFIISPPFKQVLTHQNIKAQFAILKLSSPRLLEYGEEGQLITKDKLKTYPFPKIINDFIAEANL